MSDRWFVRVYPSGPRVFRLLADGSDVLRADGNGRWISVPGRLEAVLTDPNYPDIDEATAMALLA